GWINKNITAKLNARGQAAIGLCGADLMMIPSVKRSSIPVDFGFAGDVSRKDINVLHLSQFIERGVCPVIAPITSDSHGQLLNTNADTIASAVASALSVAYHVKLIYCFEKDGVLHHSELLKSISRSEFAVLKEKKIITDGMIPKLENAFSAAGAGVSQVIIGHAANINTLIQNHGGTSITA
ncbi:MAG: amino acid kinase family protein, partial [Bacteroidia bacterium]